MNKQEAAEILAKELIIEDDYKLVSNYILGAWKSDPERAKADFALADDLMPITNPETLKRFSKQ